MGYTVGGSELLRKLPETIVGEKDDAAVYIPVEAKIRLLLRCPARIAKAGQAIDPADFEPRLRQEAANALVGLGVGDGSVGLGVGEGFTVDVACVQEFQPGGA